MTCDGVPERDCPTLSLGLLSMHGGFKFYWEGMRPRLVTAEGEHFYFEGCGNTPCLTDEQQVINKDNGLEACAFINAATARTDFCEGTLGITTSPDIVGTPDVGEFFYLGIFAGSGRPSPSVGKDLVVVGR